MASTTSDSITAEGGVKEGSSGTLVTQRLKGTASITLGSLAAGAEADKTFTATGAATGDAVHVNYGDASPATGLTIEGAVVSAANTVKVRISNQNATAALGTGSANLVWMTWSS